MLSIGKESREYLGRLANNVEEKTDMIERGLENQALPKTEDGRIKIVELGTGGGESLRRLRDISAKEGNIDLLGVDILPAVAASVKEKLGIETIAADASMLPFPDSSLSGVNASSVFHEISSYGARGPEGAVVYGKEAIIAVLSELDRVLIPGGMVAYRDMLAPAGDRQQAKEVLYKQESWHLFAEWFLHDFSRAEPAFYSGSAATMNRVPEGFSLNAPIGLQREIQRHYLMFRDYLRNESEAFGIEIERSSWLKETEGLKSITFSAAERWKEAVGRYGFESYGSSQRRMYRGDSDKFDALYDELIETAFKMSASGEPGGEAYKKLFDAWKKREGSEHYIYGNVADLLRLSVRAGVQKGNGYVLFPESSRDIAVAPRYYYNRYLAKVADNPEKDGKQMIAFKKIPKREVPAALEALAGSDPAREVLGDIGLSELQQEARTLFDNS